MPTIPYVATGDATLDHVMSGGLPQGYCCMLAGPAGCGKTTLLRKVAASIARSGKRCMFVSCDETEVQTRQGFVRAGHFETFSENLIVLSSSDSEAIAKVAREREVEVLLVDGLAAVGIAHVVEVFVHACRAAFEAGGALTVLLACHSARSGRHMGDFTNARHWADGCFVMEHVDPATMKKVDEPTGYMKLRVQGKYRCGSPMHYGYYRMTAKGLVAS